jgi:hypothetical protein
MYVHQIDHALSKVATISEVDCTYDIMGHYVYKNETNFVSTQSKYYGDPPPVRYCVRSSEGRSSTSRILQSFGNEWNRVCCVSKYRKRYNLRINAKHSYGGHSCLHLLSERERNSLNNGRFTQCVTIPFRHSSIFVPSEWSLFTLSVVFRHLPEQHMIGGLRLFPLNMQPTATECIFLYLLIIRTSVITEW